DRSSGPPTFAEALRALPAGLVMAVDTKDPRAAAPVAEEVRRQRAQARVLLWAQSMDAVRTYRQALPGVEAALLRDTRTPVEHRRYLEDAVAVGAGAISLHQDAAVPEVIDAARARGLTVYCWLQTLAKHEERRHARLDGVVTDWPVKAREL